MDFSQFLTKRKTIALILISILLVFCYIIAYRGMRNIYDSLTPLTSGNIEAMFYVQNPDSGSVTCIGDGLINTTSEISGNTEAVSSAIVTSPDNSANWGDQLIVVWNSIRYADDEYRVYGTLEPASRQTTTISFANVEELKAANLSVGETVSTRGYYSDGDLGGATYTISDTAVYNHKNISIPLSNGLFANIKIIGGTVNVASIGLFPDKNLAPIFFNLEKALSSDVNEYIFNNGTYYISSPLRLGGFTYSGSSSTTWAVDSTFSQKTYRIVRADSKDWNNVPLNLSINNINFLYEINKNSILTECEAILLAVAGCENCNIYNCTFTARPANENGCFAKADLLWFRDGLTKNIRIENSRFDNYSCTEKTSTHKIGGCFWYMGANDYVVNSIIVNNSSFTNTNSDEAVGLWTSGTGNFKHVEFNDCSFMSAVHQSDGMVGLNSAQFEKVLFNNCSFQSNIGTKKILYFYKLKPNQLTDINVKNCSFINNNLDPNSMVPGDGDLNCYIYVIANQQEVWTLNVENCSFKSLTNDYVIRNIVNLTNSPKVVCNFDESNTVEVNTSAEHISRKAYAGSFYPAE